MCDSNTLICDDKLDDLLDSALITDSIHTEQPQQSQW